MAFKLSQLWLNLYVRLAALAVCLVTPTAIYFGGFYRSWTIMEILLFYLPLVLCGFIVYAIWQNNRNNLRKLRLMLEAVKNNDFSFRFPLSNLTLYDKSLNESLNKMNRLLLEAKQDTIERERFYDKILETVTTGIVVVDNKGFVLRCNPASLQLLGISNFDTVLQLGQVGPSVKRAFSDIKAGGKMHVSYQTAREDVHLMLRCASINLRGTPLRIIALNNIKSEMDEKEMESWIRLTRVLTHEIMNSIAPINSLSDTLIHNMQQTSEVKSGELEEGLSVIRTTSQGLMNFVESYRKFASLQTPVPALVYARDLLAEVQRLHPSTDCVTYNVAINPEDIIVYADANLIRQVLLNLTKNAIQAGATTIGLRSFCLDNESVVIEVSNNGSPIPSDEAEQIFVPFFTTKQNGSGIGLSVSRQIMKLSGGSISLRQKPLAGYHTTFVLQFN